MSTIYIYETDYSKSLIKKVFEKEYTNFKKVCISPGDITKDIEKQFTCIPHDSSDTLYNILYRTEAINNYNEELSLEYIIESLHNKGYYNIPNTSWFSISLEEITSIISSLKSNRVIHISSTGKRILKMLEMGSLSISSLSDIINESVPYTSCEVYKLYKAKLVYRFKQYNSNLHKVTYYYTLKNRYSTEVNYSLLSKRNNKFLNELNLSLEEIINIIKDCSIKEAIQKLCDTTEYSYSTIEKFFTELRKVLEVENLIKYECINEYKNCAKVIRKV